MQQKQFSGSLQQQKSTSGNKKNLKWTLKKTKAKINRWDYINLKSFCTVKETISKTKKLPTEWEKLFANDVPNKGFSIQNLQTAHEV